MLTRRDLDAMADALLHRSDSRTFCGALERAIGGQGSKYPESEERHRKIVQAVVGMLGLESEVASRIASQLPRYPSSPASAAEHVVNAALDGSPDAPPSVGLRRLRELRAKLNEMPPPAVVRRRGKRSGVQLGDDDEQ